MRFAPHVEEITGRLAIQEALMARRKSGTKQWVRSVKTVSTFPPEGIFTKDAATIAKVMARKEVSPKGVGSAIRMIQYFINRAGKNLPADRKKHLEEAKRILREKLKRPAHSVGAKEPRDRRGQRPTA